jgi:hypothetical protein
LRGGWRRHRRGGGGDGGSKGLQENFNLNESKWRRIR